MQLQISELQQNKEGLGVTEEKEDLLSGLTIVEGGEQNQSQKVVALILKQVQDIYTNLQSCRSVSEEGSEQLDEVQQDSEALRIPQYQGKEETVAMLDLTVRDAFAEILLDLISQYKSQISMVRDHAVQIKQQASGQKGNNNGVFSRLISQAVQPQNPTSKPSVGQLNRSSLGQHTLQGEQQNRGRGGRLQNFLSTRQRPGKQENDNQESLTFQETNTK
eukprot:TRINITY_DN23090_c0_g1_i5.p1 TRINITY_DN23090_c0_g1~~TRINITY_DN23090_c0_g1_i5.p1  ORF type:complete len:219 (+),score=23.41 TRINITY_DN23090_c0_g1_i5:183-839(+)